MATNKSRLNSKGLDKIFGEGINDVIKEIEKGNISDSQLVAGKTEIAIVDILPNPHQPRKLFNNSNLQELAQSIAKYGVIQPIIVKKNINNKYYLVAGERRTRAAKIAGLEKISAVIVNLTDAQMKEVALVENIQRVDLSPIEEAHAYKELLELLAITQEQLSEQVGKSRSHIANTLRLLSLPSEVQNMVLSGALTMGQVKPLVSITASPQNIIELAQKIKEQELNSREVEQLVKNYTNHETTIKKITDNDKEKNSRTINKYLENKIMKKLGTKVVIEGKKLVISYHGIGDLNRILEILNLTEE